MKKKLLYFVLASLISGGSFAQVTELGGPKSWKKNVPAYNKIEVVQMPGFDEDAIRVEDELNDLSKDRPWRFGYKYETDITFSNSGEWIDLPDGRLWRVGVEAEGAISVNLIFEDYYLPEGASIYLFDYEGTNRIGAYTSRNNRPDSLLGTELIVGDKIIVEYYEPNEVSGQGSFKIANVIHGYRTIAHSTTTVESEFAKALNGSGDCNIDVHCPLGNGWENQIRSVAMIVVGGNGYCSGALINNICDDGTPYFLTANHCTSGSNTGNWAFRFNWASPPGTEVCATTANSTDPGPPYDQTANGATLLVSGTAADYALLQIDNMTVNDAINWNLFYAGWNNDDTDGSITQATGIHHPSGDVMKICREDDSPYHSTSSGAQVWWIDQYEQGVTEPGSSGSPLFDQNGRIIGQLYGGAAACSGTVNNGQYDYFGRLGVSWGLGIGDYLAPVGCGGDTIYNNGWDPSGPAMDDDASIQTIESPDKLYCQETFTPVVRLRNAGGNDLTSCVINYNIDGGTNLTYNWNGILPSFSTELVTLPTMTGTGGVHTFNAFTTLPNGNTDSNPANDASVSNFELSLGGIETTISISTDCWGYETYWEVTDVSSNLMGSGGNSTGIPPGGGQTASAGDAGSYGDEMTIDETLCLAVGCYDFTIYDDWGDGIEGSTSWGCNTDGGYQITNTSGTVLATIQTLNFGNSETNNFCVVDNAGIDEVKSNDFAIYPNPNTGTFTIEMGGAFGSGSDVTIRDLTGRVVYQGKSSAKQMKVSLDQISNGTYFVTIMNEESTVSKPIIIN